MVFQISKMFHSKFAIILSLLILLPILLDATSSKLDKIDDDTHFDEDAIRKTLEDVRDRISEFVTSPKYEIYWEIAIEKAIQLLKHVDKRTIKLVFDLITKNPDLATKIYDMAQNKKQERIKEALRNPEAIKLVSDWINQFTSSENPSEMMQNILDNIGLGRKNSSKAKTFSSSTKEEL